jgi:hypothetical protein
VVSGRTDAGLDSAKISVEDHAQDFLERFSLEAAVRDPFVTLSAQGVYTRSPQKICKRSQTNKLPRIGLLARPLYEISVEALYKSSLGKIYVRDLLARSLQQISMECLCTRTP